MLLEACASAATTRRAAHNPFGYLVRLPLLVHIIFSRFVRHDTEAKHPKCQRREALITSGSNT